MNTPDTPFQLEFDYRFDTPTGDLTVRLDGADLVSVPAAVSAIMQTQTIAIDVPHLSKSGVMLEFELDGPAGSAVALDDIRFPGLINGRFASGDLYAWIPDVPDGGTAGVIDLPPTEPLIFADSFESAPVPPAG